MASSIRYAFTRSNASRNPSKPIWNVRADLLRLLPANTLSGLRQDLLLLDRFYIPTRYPDALPGTLPQGAPSQEDAQEALDLAGNALAHIEHVLQRP